ncbi:MAG: hypothetical protein NTZ95_01330 [Candidatus Omnitrophica bacterium]|nr:hypothetical protein [Candidatus Omnitrophota bacterium]
MKKIILLAILVVFFSGFPGYSYPLDSPQDDVIYRYADDEAEKPKPSVPKPGALEQVLQAIGNIPVQAIKLWRSEQ